MIHYVFKIIELIVISFYNTILTLLIISSAFATNINTNVGTYKSMNSRQ